MKTTNEYLDQIKKKHGLVSDYALAKFLETSTAAITRYRKNLSTMDDDMALKVADALNLNPLEPIAAANAERAKDEKKRRRWLSIAKVAAVLIAIVAAYALPSPSNSLNPIIFSLYIMLNISYLVYQRLSTKIRDFGVIPA